MGPALPCRPRRCPCPGALVQPSSPPGPRLSSGDTLGRRGGVCSGHTAQLTSALLVAPGSPWTGSLSPSEVLQRWEPAVCAGRGGGWPATGVSRDGGTLGTTVAAQEAGLEDPRRDHGGGLSWSGHGH